MAAPSRAKAPFQRLRQSGLALVLLLAASALQACGGGNPAPPSSPPPTAAPSPVSVTIQGQVYSVVPGTSVGKATQAFGIKITNGALLDVTGSPLKPNEYPARIKVNGKRAERSTPLQAGAIVEIAAGRDHTEDTTEERKDSNSEQQLNPQYALGSAPGEEITTRGVLSDKVASIVFKPSRRAEAPKTVALTFDDGPTPSYTPRILQILKRENVPATFFIVGYLAERYPELIRQEIADGHAIGNHTWSHPLTPPFSQMDQRQLENQITRTNEALQDLDVNPFLFRAPGGSINDDVVETARRNGLRTIQWTIDGKDYLESTSPKEIVQRIVQQLKPGSIILMHDGGGNASNLVKALPILIREIRSRGYGFTALTK